MEQREYCGAFVESIDARGLNCPLPLLKMKRALAHAQRGERVYLQATDPNTLRDITAYAYQANHALVHASTLGTVFHLVVEKV
ncbi:MAG: sulfurtransferase TusA family protein [Gammaproteobacteria bacterium]|nr:sulfurtransferase TusA family protein [Gammaproteobacteria bacterium]